MVLAVTLQLNHTYAVFFFFCTYLNVFPLTGNNYRLFIFALLRVQ